MRILGDIVERFGLYGIDAAFKCPELNIDDTVSLIIDTGASRTTISTVDMLRLKGMDYDYKDLKPVEGPGIISVEGNTSNTLDTFELPKSKLIFTDEDTGENIAEDVENGCILRHKNLDQRIRRLLSERPAYKPTLNDHNYPSLLGMDILRDYKLKFNEWSAILE